MLCQAGSPAPENFLDIHDQFGWKVRPLPCQPERHGIAKTNDSADACHGPADEFGKLPEDKRQIPLTTASRRAGWRNEIPLDADVSNLPIVVGIQFAVHVAAVAALLEWNDAILISSVMLLPPPWAFCPPIPGIQVFYINKLLLPLDSVLGLSETWIPWDQLNVFNNLTWIELGLIGIPGICMDLIPLSDALPGAIPTTRYSPVVIGQAEGLADRR